MEWAHQLIILNYFLHLSTSVSLWNLNCWSDRSIIKLRRILKETNIISHTCWFVCTDNPYCYFGIISVLSTMYERSRTSIFSCQSCIQSIINLGLSSIFWTRAKVHLTRIRQSPVNSNWAHCGIQLIWTSHIDIRVIKFMRAGTTVRVFSSS